MPKIAHTMAIPPGFPAYRRRDMRAKKSSKNLLRISGLALVFMLAVALLVSAISFTRVGAGEINETHAAMVSPSEGNKHLDIAVPEKYIPSVLDGTSANNYFAQFTYNPANYKNFHAYLKWGGAGISNVKLEDTYASMEPKTGANRPMRMFAYYKLPDYLVNVGAEIEISANLGDAVKFTDVRNTYMFVSYASSVTDINESSNDISGTYSKGTTWTVTSDKQYILVCAGGEENGSEKIEISGLAINIKIKSVNSLSAYKEIVSKLTTNVAPVTISWDGTTTYSADFGEYRNIAQNFETNRNTVANLGTWGLHAEDIIDPSSNSLVSIRTDGMQTKQFSFLLYDKYLSLDTADIKGFDLFQAYRGTGAITDGSAKTYKRDDYTAEQLKTLRYPVGLKSITVEPFAFDNNDPATGSFRGLYVTVIYDGKDNGLLPIETDTAYLVNYANVNKVSGKTLTVFCGGIDYTPACGIGRSCSPYRKRF